MKITQVKKVPSRAHRQVKEDGVYWTFYKTSFLYVYEPFVNFYGVHVFVRYTYDLKSSVTCNLPSPEK